MRASRTEIAALIGIVAVALAAAWQPLWTAVDDAFISARYADQLVAGHGFRWSASDPPVEGFSNPLWTGWIAVGLALGAPAHGWMVGWGLAGWLTGLPAAWLLARALSTPDAPGTPLLAPWLLAASPLLAVACTNGLETGWYLALVLWASWGALVAEGRWTWLAGAALGLLAWSRPEGVLVGAIWIGWRGWERKPSIGLAAPWALAIAALLGWRLATFGALLPHPAGAKIGARGWTWILQQNWTYLRRDGWTWPVVATVAVAAGLWPPVHRARLALVALGLALIAPAALVELWMPGARLLLPLYLCAAIALASRVGDRRVAAALGVAVALAAIDLAPRAWIQDAAHSALPDNGAARAGRWLRERLPEGSRVELRDAGVLAFWLGPRIETWELHDRPLTRAASAVRPPDPTVLVLTVTREDAEGSRYAADRAAFEARTVPYTYLGRVHQHRHRYYDLYARTDAGIEPLPPEIAINRLGASPALR